MKKIKEAMEKVTNGVMNTATQAAAVPSNYFGWYEPKVPAKLQEQLKKETK